MILKEAPRISAMLASLIVGKAAVIALLSLAFGMSFANAQRSGLLLAQGGKRAVPSASTYPLANHSNILIALLNLSIKIIDSHATVFFRRVCICCTRNC